ncbi:MAG: hypothetical protein AB1634_13300 [Thermodesulfobacteriota bacterium]
MKRSVLSVVVALAVGGAGCSLAPQTVRTPVPAPPPPVVAPPLPIQAEPLLAWPEAGFLEGRLAAARGRLAAWQELDQRRSAAGSELGDPGQWQACVRELEGIDRDYQFLRARQSVARDGAIGEEDLEAIFRTHRRDFAFLEGECPALMAQEEGRLAAGPIPVVVPEPEAAGGEVPPALAEALAAGRFAELVAAYRELEGSSPELARTTPARKAYALSLIRIGQLDEAVTVLADLLDRGLGLEELWVLGRYQADLLLALGRFAEARAAYSQLLRIRALPGLDEMWIGDKLALLEDSGETAEGLPAFAALMRQWLLLDGLALPDGMAGQVAALEGAYPGSALAARARYLLQMAEDRIRRRAADLLLQVDTQIQHGDLGQARQLLEEVLAQPLLPEIREVAERLLADLEAASASHAEARQRLADQGEEERWTEALRLLDLGQYDAAIPILDSLLDTSLADQVRPRLAEAVDASAGEKRRQAAELFAQARSTSQPALRRERLSASRALLLEILSRYPGIPLADKVRQNLATVEAFMEETDPGLLRAAP